MAFEEVKENFEDLKDQAKTLYDANIRYYKLMGFKIAMKAGAKIAKIIMFLFLLLLVVLFLSLALALGIGYALNNFAYGFLIVGVLYLIVLGIVYANRNSIIEGRMLSKYSKKFFK
ncbi:hypothetical protein GCM10007424_16690 [Flavobacterium suaedae]|uniref:Competence protein n=1 Tax=Flavobacterium suaedae TaxID=1767027 RepID=A0ABQ1JTD7_9FLAO|nr:phage holin family protein [Flavobacterium suaedae]GGB77301.1 hypothetical protein GCM10007424_16690 [Flavobacterium suaedae]